MKLKKGFIRIGLFVILVAIVVSIYVFLSKDDGEKILVSRQNILHGTIITESNFDEYVYTINTDKSMKPDDVIMEKEQIIGRSVIYDIAGNTIITDSVLSDEEEIAIHMNNPVISGIKATDISQFSGGIVRKGDYIDISVIDNITGACADVLENVYVFGAYNSDGTLIEDNNGYAMILNILIEKEHEQHLNSMLSKGTIRICKHEKRYADE